MSHLGELLGYSEQLAGQKYWEQDREGDCYVERHFASPPEVPHLPKEGLDALRCGLFGGLLLCNGLNKLLIDIVQHLNLLSLHLACIRSDITLSDHIFFGIHRDLLVIWRGLWLRVLILLLFLIGHLYLVCLSLILILSTGCRLWLIIPTTIDDRSKL